ncbi:cytochrome-c peroxidase [Hoeflea poritis]|uniref:Methylamine utilization protein MauG n=1 Tax=Hoeflea poritis TaxID=2993659 RepID=A0ABT4VQ72_9HYPH|nr:cytochrome c peroxidase [Hoeflea poritis]MDA4846850.1 methylamine utilization protein MauG [Hoeflea poritis]
MTASNRAFCLAFSAVVFLMPTAPAGADGPAIESVAELGRALFFDANLSKNRSQSCSTCHAPDAGFADPRDNGYDDPVSRAVSLGDDGTSIGDRNAPTASYARFIPKFHLREDGEYVGGLFWDGREADLEGQAGGPPLNPIEMGMASKGHVVARLMENPDYVAAFKAHFGDTVFDDPENAYRAMTQSIAAFERTDAFAPFDSRYDRYLRGEVEFTKQEELGRTLFFSDQFSNCNQCHQLREIPGAERETFSNYEYHNIGTPVHTAVRAANGSGDKFADLGLLANTAVSDAEHAGKFKVPTLRNVAVTGPYMHNGVFKELRTVVAFYNQYNTQADSAKINPETGEPWGRTQFPKTLSVEELTVGPALEDERIDALVAFLKTLTDARYEHLLDDRQ